jgi:hypothetical protein
MKEYPEPNYLLRIRDLRWEEQPEVARHLIGGHVLIVNHIVHVTFLPYLPTNPWPPPTPPDLDVARDRDEAAHVVLSTSMQLVTPTDGEERIEELVGEIPEKQTIFWVSFEHYAELVREIEALGERPDLDSNWFQLSDLANGALRAFLRDDLPRSAALSSYARKILCLPPLAAPA